MNPPETLDTLELTSDNAESSVATVVQALCDRIKVFATPHSTTGRTGLDGELRRRIATVTFPRVAMEQLVTLCGRIQQAIQAQIDSSEAKGVLAYGRISDEGAHLIFTATQEPQKI